MSKINLTILTFLAILLSTSAAMADRGGNNGLHEGQEMQRGQEEQGRGFEIERQPNVFQPQTQQIRRDFKQETQQGKQQLKKQIQNIKKDIK